MAESTWWRNLLLVAFAAFCFTVLPVYADQKRPLEFCGWGQLRSETVARVHDAILGSWFVLPENESTLIAGGQQSQTSPLFTQTFFVEISGQGATTTAKSDLHGNFDLTLEIPWTSNSMFGSEIVMELTLDFLDAAMSVFDAGDSELLTKKLTTDFLRLVGPTHCINLVSGEIGLPLAQLVPTGPQPDNWSEDAPIRMLLWVVSDEKLEGIALRRFSEDGKHIWQQTRLRFVRNLGVVRLPSPAHASD